MATLDTTVRHETSMADPNALENDLRSFYLTGSEEMSIFEEWEHGIARGDSTTPSICSPTYRWWYPRAPAQRARPRPQKPAAQPRLGQRLRRACTRP